MQAEPETPFMIFALPRSRTAWLARFLSYRDWTCHHEVMARLRSINELKETLSKAKTGFAETAAAPGWHLLKHFRPDLRSVVIRRPIEDTMAAMISAAEAVGAQYDMEKLKQITSYGERCLEKIANRPRTLVLQYEELNSESGCRKIFEFCLPYRFDFYWWLMFSKRNIQVDLRHYFGWYLENKPAIEEFKRVCKLELIRLRRAGCLQL